MEDIYQNKIPKLNPEINIYHRDDEYIITFRGNNCHLKVNSNIYALLLLVDNNRSLSEIVFEYNSTIDNPIDNELAHDLFFNKLGYYNIIENDGAKHDPYRSPSYLKLNYIFINEYYTQLITRPFLFLFRGRLILPLIFFCLFVFISCLFKNHNEIINYVNEIPPVHFITYIVLLIISSIFHEMGHAAATYYYGGAHSGIGFGFYLLTPVLYSDVSSAWKFDSKKRIVVNLAGIYFELVFGTTLILIALLTSYTPILIIPIIILFKTLFNLNPFFRTDGYWILSDFFKVPNLKSTSDKYLSNFLSNRLKEKRSRIENFLIVYALISYAFIFVFLFTVIILNPVSVITFPRDITFYVMDILNDQAKLSVDRISKLIIPFMFYFLLIRLARTNIKKYYGLKQKKSSEK